MAALVVSCLSMLAIVLPVASSTMFIRQALLWSRPNQLWWLPSICTNSPKWWRRSRRVRWTLGLRFLYHRPSVHNHLRSVSWSTSKPSSKSFSAARVGPTSWGLYRVLYRAITFFRKLKEWARFDCLPRRPWINPESPSEQKRWYIRRVWR